jgi:hypothetical protein
MKLLQFLSTVLFVVGLLLVEPQRAAVIVVILFVWTLFEVRASADSKKHRLLAERLLASVMLAETAAGIILTASATGDLRASALLQAGTGLLSGALVGFVLQLALDLCAITKRKVKRVKPAETPPPPPLPQPLPVSEEPAPEPQENEPFLLVGVATG